MSPALRRTIGPLAVLSLLTACDDNPRSYSDCILKGVKSTPSQAIAAFVTRTCEDKFTHLLLIKPEGAAKLLPTSTGMFAAEFQLRNPDQEHMITRTEIRMSVLDAPFGNEIDSHTWFFTDHIRPGAAATLIGSVPVAPKGWRWSVGRVEGVNVR